MSKWKILILPLWVVLIGMSYLFNTLQRSKLGLEVDPWFGELSKAFMGLAMSLVVGGLIKLLLDQYERERIAAEKQKAFKSDIIGRLRKVFDAVDSSRLLIEAHQSARTYGEKMRDNILPSITTLYDIKRSLIDAYKTVGKMLPALRISLHYMIAYLTALADEYRDEYPDISNAQYYEEGVQQKRRELFVLGLANINPSLSVMGNVAIPPASKFTWRKILELPCLHDFLGDERKACYYTIFIEHYEYCKAVLRNDKSGEQLPKPESFDNQYFSVIERMDAQRGHRKTGQQDDSIGPSDNLVALIMKDKLFRMTGK